MNAVYTATKAVVMLVLLVMLFGFAAGVAWGILDRMFRVGLGLFA